MKKISNFELEENFQNLPSETFVFPIFLLVKARKQRVNGKGDLEQKRDCRGIEFSRGTKRDR